MIKIKAKYDCLAGGYKKGDIFNAKEEDGYYLFMDSHGHDRMRHIDDLTMVDEQKIEVGSEWVNSKGRELVVIFKGEYTVVAKWKDDNKEFTCSIKNHGRFYKPKPKTVTMYFYRQHTERLFASEFPPNFTELLFTREIELL